MHKHDHQETIKCSSCVNGELNKNETYNEPVIAAGRRDSVGDHCAPWQCIAVSNKRMTASGLSSVVIMQVEFYQHCHGRLCFSTPFIPLPCIYCLHSCRIRSHFFSKPGNASASPIDLHAPCGKSAVKSLGDALTL